MAKNANPLALVATAQTLQDPYYQTSKPHKSYAPTSKASLPTRSHATTRLQRQRDSQTNHTTHPDTASEEYSEPVTSTEDKDMYKKLPHCKVLQDTSTTLPTRTHNFHQTPETRMWIILLAEKFVQLQAEKSDRLADTDE
ncbi:hypothetical protein Tco_1362347 [Tanacetum coccineum]